jgi:hypothetical protein
MSQTHDSARPTLQERELQDLEARIARTGCTCPHAWRKSLGVLYGVKLMGGYVRTLTVKTCPEHGR